MATQIEVLEEIRDLLKILIEAFKGDPMKMESYKEKYKK